MLYWKMGIDIKIKTTKNKKYNLLAYKLWKTGSNLLNHYKGISQKLPREKHFHIVLGSEVKLSLINLKIQQ